MAKRIMPDRSVSWVQPGSTHLGWEGKCGQTAGANVITTHVHADVGPEVLDAAGGDVTPGCRPGTLVKMMNTVMHRRGPGWKRVYRETSNADLTKARPDAPIICLLRWDALTLHYVTVVRVECGTVYYNTWGEQLNESMPSFREKWSLRPQSLLSTLIEANPIVILLRELKNFSCIV